jgi:hypothetical protein
MAQRSKYTHAEAAAHFDNDAARVMSERQRKRDAVLRLERGACDVCGERVPDNDAVMHYHAGVVISLDGS